MYSMAMEDCQDLDSQFEENARKDLVGMMELYEKSTFDIQRYIQWPEMNFEEEHPVPITLFEEIEREFEKVKAEVQAKEEFSIEDNPLKAIDGLLPLYNICAKVCDQHGGVQEVKYSPQCKESTHLQLKKGKDIIATRGMEQTLPQ